MNSLQEEAIEAPTEALTESLVQPSSENELIESQAVFEELIILAAAISSLLLQIANPSVSRAIVAHSRVFHDPVARLLVIITWT